MTVDQHETIDSVIDLVNLDTADHDGLIVVRQGIDEGTGRRYDHFITAIAIDEVENTILIVVLAVCISIALDESETVREGVGIQGPAAVERDGRILGRDHFVVPGDDPVLLGDITDIVIHRIVDTIGIGIIGKADPVEIIIPDGPVEHDTERRTADYEDVSVCAVVDIIVDVEGHAVTGNMGHIT